MGINSIQFVSTNNGIIVGQEGNQSFAFPKEGIITGTVSGIGKQASVTIQDKVINVSEEIVKDKQIGDEMQFQVSPSKDGNVVLKAMQEVAKTTGSDDALESLSQTKVQRDTSQMVSILSESDLSVDTVAETKENGEQTAKFSAEDLKMLRQMGIDVAHSDLSHLVGLVNQYHAQQDGRSFQTGSAEVATAIAQAQNMDKVSDGAKRYLLDQKMPFTYENAYKAEYSSTDLPTTSLSEEEWQQLCPQVDKMLQEQGMPVNQENQTAARWMIEHGCDISKDNIELYQNIEDFNLNGLDVDSYAQNLKAQWEATGTFFNTPLAGNSIAKQAGELVDQLQEVTPEAVDKVIDQHQTPTLSHLFQAQQELANDESRASKDLVANAQTNEIRQDAPAQEVAAQGTVQGAAQGTPQDVTSTYVKLQQIQLRMTLETSYQLLNKGYGLANENLEEIIAQLNALEEQNQSMLFTDSKVSFTEENVDLYQQTMTVVQAVGAFPETTLGALLPAENYLTLRLAYQQGVASATEWNQNQSGTSYVNIQGTLTSTVNNGLSGEDARKRYESVMTAPRSDMGDHITKAFANMDAMMDEMDLDNNEENRKAIRILAYNQIAITKENVNRIITLDNNLMSNINAMTPEVVLGMIRDQKNPIDLTMEELREEIAKQQEKNGDSKESKYSEFLYHLEKNGEITPEEKESYIGIYRLLNEVTSFSDRDLGSLSKGEQQITLNNLLTAHQSRKKTGTETTIDDDFGMVSEIRTYGQSIRNQIAAAFANVESGSRESISKQNQIALEQQEQQEQQEQELQELSLEQLKEMSHISKESITFLDDIAFANTPANLQAARQMVEHSSALYSGIKEEMKKHHISDEEIQSSLEELERALLAGEEESDVAEVATEDAANETTISPYESFSQWMNQCLERDSSGLIDLKNLQNMKQIHTMMSMANAASARSQYFVPVELPDETVTMNLTLNHSEDNSAGIIANVSTKQLGNIHLQATVNDSGANVTIEAETKEGQEALERVADQYKDAITKTLEEGNRTNRNLYSAARNFVTLVRALV